MKRTRLTLFVLLAVVAVACSSNGDGDSGADFVEPQLLVDSACGSDTTPVTVDDDTALVVSSSGDAPAVSFKSDGGSFGFAVAASALHPASVDLNVQPHDSTAAEAVATLQVSVEERGERESDGVCEVLALDAGAYEIFTESDGVESVSFGVFHLSEGTS